MTTDEVNAPIDPRLNRQQVMMPAGASASRDRARQFVRAASSATAYVTTFSPLPMTTTPLLETV